MASKPFIAARIPESLNLKLEEHSKTTGEGRTQTLINALSVYLGFTLEAGSKENASDRLSMLERRVEELERLVKEPHQISLLDTSSIAAKKPAPKTKAEPESKFDNKTDNTSDNKHQLASADTERLNNHEMTARSSLTYEAVRSRHKHKKPIEVDGKKYLPIKEGSSCKWQPT